MMEYYQVTSYSLTNGIRMFMCLFMVIELAKLKRITKSTAWISLVCGILTAVLCLSSMPQISVNALEVFVILIMLYLQNHCEFRICAFLTFFFEIAVALWDFLISAGFAIIFHNETFVDDMTYEHTIAVWAVRLLMIGFVVLIVKQKNKIGKALNQFVTITALAGMICVLLLTEQSVISLPDEQLMTWVILSVILLVSVLFYKLNRQYEMEKEIAMLKTEQKELLECDYKSLTTAYSTNAKLYHDLNNHLNALYSYISQGKFESALRYIEDLRSPVEKITRNIWTNDVAIDYLISSKIAIAEQSGIKTKVNIEFPRHTNIKSADLAAILGNLLDNALEAMVYSSEFSRFLYLTIRRINDMLVIKVENSCCMKPDINGMEIITTKSDSGMHGWGLKSARAATERYDGTLEVLYSNGTFCAVATLSFEAV